MTNPTPPGQVPEALRLADYLDDLFDADGEPKQAAAELRRLHAYCQELESQVFLDCMTHVQNHAENEHVAGDVSKNGAELNMSAQQPAPPQEAQGHEGHKQATGSSNCMQCCVGYILGLPIEKVPHFANGGGWDQFIAFAKSQGYAAVMLPGAQVLEADYLASGKTNRGTSHMVVMNDGKLVFDPHPSNAGLSTVQCVWVLAKLAGTSQKPIGWLYDWMSDGGKVRDWFSQDYDEAYNPTNQCHNIRPLYTSPVAHGDALDAARWRWLSEHIQVAWNEGKFTSLVRIVSEQHRQSLNASVDRMMAGDWSDAARVAQEGKSHG